MATPINYLNRSYRALERVEGQKNECAGNTENTP